MYEVLLAGHLLCAVLWAGGGVTLHLLGRRSLAEGPEAAVAQAERGGWFGAHVYAPLSVLLLLFGILLVGEAGYKHSQLWVAIAYAGWLIAFALGAFVYPRVAKRLEDAVEQHGRKSDEAVVQVRRFLALNTIEITVLLLVVVDMAFKPGA